jgi:ligand-binding sensor domain-containing protein
MSKLYKKIFLLVSLIAVISFACSFGAKNNAENSSGEAVQNTEEPQTTVNQDANILDLSMLDDRIELPEGGISVRPVKGYQIEQDGGSIIMLAPGADPDVGPMIQIIGLLSDTEITVDEMLEQLRSGTDLKIGTTREISVSEQLGILVEINGGESDPDKQGQILLAVVDGHQQLMMIGGSSIADWPEFAPTFEAVTDSLEFIPLTIPEAVSSVSSGRYTYTNRNVVRDLVEKDGIIYAATLGGLVAWDLKTGSLGQEIPTTGMGHISTNSVVYCEIPEPRILVGTLEGISIFNPATGSWEERQLLPVDNYVSKAKIERLYCDQINQRLLIGYSGLGVLDLTTNDFVQYTDKNGLLWNSIVDIAVQGSDIWISTGYKGIAKINGGQVTTFTKTEGLPDDVASALTFSEDGTLWIGANSGIISYKNGNWQFFGSDSPARLSNISEIEGSSANSLWVSTGSFGAGRLCLFNPQTAACDLDLTSSDGMPIIALTNTSVGSAVFGTSKGITVVDNGELVSLTTDDHLISNYVDSLTIAPDGKLWVGTDGGVQIIDPANPTQPWMTYTTQDQPDMGGNWASAIAFEPNGTGWFTLINGSASRFQNGQWTAFKDIYSYNAVAVDTRNRVWFADDSKGIVILDEQGNQVMAYTTANGLPSDNVQALILDQQGTMWIGTNQGLAKVTNDQLSVVFDKDNKDLPNVYVRALALDQNGNVVIGCFTGVSVYDGSTPITVVDFLKDGFSDARLTALSVSPSGELWIGTDKGLLHGSSQLGWTLMNTTSGLLTNYISALTIDPFGTVWVGGGGSNFDGGGLVHIVP